MIRDDGLPQLRVCDLPPRPWVLDRTVCSRCGCFVASHAVPVKARRSRR